MDALFRRLAPWLLGLACLALSACAHQSGPRSAGHAGHSQGAYADGYGAAYPPAYPPAYEGGRYRGRYEGRERSRWGVVDVQYGRVRSIEREHARETGARRESRGGGAVAGAIIGGVIGNQIGRDDASKRRGGHREHGRDDRGDGSGGGRAAATMIGAIGGALIGNAIEQGGRRETAGAGEVFHVLVRLEDRSERWFAFERLDGLRVGDHVRIENGRLQRW
jgi:outer membrane lipoprotein SlyB